MPITRIKTSPTGPEFSRFIAGYWRLVDWDLTPQQRLTFLSQHLDLGITTIDHADIYGGYQAQILFGEALALNPALRDRIEIISKCGINLTTDNRPAHRLKHYDTSHAHIVSSVEQSLKELQTDYLDLLLIHRPDPLMDADEIASAFSSLKQQGKVKYFGVSNFTPVQCRMLQSRLDEPLVTNQIELSPLNFGALHDGTLDYCQQHRMAPMIWSALGGGNLFTSDSESCLRIREVLHRIAAERPGATPEQIVYAWIMRHPTNPLPLIGSSNIARYHSAFEAESIVLDRQEWFDIWRAAAGREIP